MSQTMGEHVKETTTTTRTVRDDAPQTTTTTETRTVREEVPAPKKPETIVIETHTEA